MLLGLFHNLQGVRASLEVCIHVHTQELESEHPLHTLPADVDGLQRIISHRLSLVFFYSVFFILPQSALFFSPHPQPADGCTFLSPLLLEIFPY